MSDKLAQAIDGLIEAAKSYAEAELEELPSTAVDLDAAKTALSRAIAEDRAALVEALGRLIAEHDEPEHNGRPSTYAWDQARAALAAAATPKTT